MDVRLNATKSEKVTKCIMDQTS